MNEENNNKENITQHNSNISEIIFPLMFGIIAVVVMAIAAHFLGT